MATGYFDGTGQQEIAVAPGRGHTPTVKVFDLFGDLIFQFQAYASNFTGGINVAAGNVEGLTSGGHELDDIVTAPTYGVADIRVFHNQFPANPAMPVTLFREFNPFGTSFIGGATVAAADMTGDGKADIIVGSGPAWRRRSKFSTRSRRSASAARTTRRSIRSPRASAAAFGSRRSARRPTSPRR